MSTTFTGGIPQGLIWIDCSLRRAGENEGVSILWGESGGEIAEKGLSFVGLGKKTLPDQQEDKPMPQQHNTEEEANQDQGIVVPLELEGLRLLKQELQPDGTIRLEVIGTNERAKCPHCQNVCVKRHDVRPRSKRDAPLRGQALADSALSRN